MKFRKKSRQLLLYKTEYYPKSEIRIMCVFEKSECPGTCVVPTTGGRKKRISKSEGLAGKGACARGDRHGRRPCEIITERSPDHGRRQHRHRINRRGERAPAPPASTVEAPSSSSSSQRLRSSAPRTRNDFLKWRHTPPPRQLTFPATSARSASSLYRGP